MMCQPALPRPSILMYQWEDIQDRARGKMQCHVALHHTFPSGEEGLRDARRCIILSTAELEAEGSVMGNGGLSLVIHMT
jgi:hypothetical protein